MTGIDPEVTPLERALGRKAMAVLCAGVFGIAVVGFAIGIRGNALPERALAPDPVPSDSIPANPSAPPAPTYLEIAKRPLGPNSAYVSALPTLHQPADSAPPTRPEPAERARALSRRSERRAFDGAPPVIPHAIDARTASACLACHGDGTVIADVVARKIPHPVWSQCTQCHVEATNRSFADFVLAENRFAGFSPGSFAHRAAPGAPPVTPHATTIRQDCLSCHGSKGEPGLRTSHPERQNCLQCHPPAVDLDFRAPVAGEAFLPPIRIEDESP